jgi:L-lactate utilization protein LutB
MTFHCTICGQESTRICVWCTRDNCVNHLCEKCGRCSDCCECQVPLEETVRETARTHIPHPHPEPFPPSDPSAPDSNQILEDEPEPDVATEVPA